MHVQRYIDWKRHTRSNIFSFPVNLIFSCCVSFLDCTSFVYPNLFLVIACVQFFSSNENNYKFSIPCLYRVGKKMCSFSSCLEKKEKKKTRIPPSPKKYTRCPPPKRTTPNPKSLDDTRMNEACLYVCVGERKIEE